MRKAGGANHRYRMTTNVHTDAPMPKVIVMAYEVDHKKKDSQLASKSQNRRIWAVEISTKLLGTGLLQHWMVAQASGHTRLSKPPPPELGLWNPYSITSN